MRKTCGNCQHFTHEPNTPSRGVCWHSAEFDYYVVRGEHYKGCDDWTERRETNYQRFFDTPEKAAAYLASHTRCADCELLGATCSTSKLCKQTHLEWLEGEAND